MNGVNKFRWATIFMGVENQKRVKYHGFLRGEVNRTRLKSVRPVDN